MTRPDGRKNDQMRPVTMITGVQKDPAGSVQVSFGDTVVLCAATVSEEVPGWLARQGGERGWITGEYAMLPGSTPGRASRRKRGRSEEIQRLIGRSLRSAVDLSLLGPRTITVDCDVLQADGGTRTAAITGGYLAVELAVHNLIGAGKIEKSPVRRQVCAVSCVVLGSEVLLDPDYQEDSRADVDMNFVMSGDGKFIEVQGTAEGDPFDQDTLGEMIALARTGSAYLWGKQRELLS